MSSPSTTDRLQRIGGMATMPSRANSLRIALQHVLPQLDRLYVYLDKHATVPDELIASPKIVPILPATIGNFAAAGKFLGLHMHREPCLYFAFDDDILYPPQYVELLARALYRYHYRAIVGIHAAIFKAPHLSYAHDRNFIHFQAGLGVDCMVDELGSGTIGFHSRCLDLDPREWPHHDMADLLIAIEAVRQGIPRIAVSRPDNYLRAIAEGQVDSLWNAVRKDDSRQTAIMRRVLEEHRFRWCNYASYVSPKRPAA